MFSHNKSNFPTSWFTASTPEPIEGAVLRLFGWVCWLLFVSAVPSHCRRYTDKLSQVRVWQANTSFRAAGEVHRLVCASLAVVRGEIPRQKDVLLYFVRLVSDSFRQHVLEVNQRAEHRQADGWFSAVRWMLAHREVGGSMPPSRQKRVIAQLVECPTSSQASFRQQSQQQGQVVVRIPIAGAVPTLTTCDYRMRSIVRPHWSGIVRLP